MSKRNAKQMIYVVIFMLLLELPLLAQNVASLKGTIRGEDGQNIDYFNAILLSTRDSSMVMGDTFWDGKFEFKEIESQAYILRILNVQHQTADTLITILPGENRLEKPILLKGLKLPEIVIKGNRPVILQKNGNLTLDIHNSYLKKENSLINILKKSPGILVDQMGNISMFGGKEPLVYINENEIHSQSQLQTLQPADIEKIEIIRNPGAEYSASYDAVIKIWTRKQLEDRLNVNVNNNTYINRDLTNEVNIGIQFHKGRWSQQLNYYNCIGNGRQYDKSSSYVFHLPDTILNDRDMTVKNNIRRDNLFYSLLFDLNKNNSFGFQYSGIISKWNLNHRGLQTIYQNSLETTRRKLNNEEDENKYLHNFSLNYKSQLTIKSALSVVTDYAFSKVKMENSINENNFQSNDLLNQSFNLSTSNYDIFSVTPDFSSCIGAFNYTLGGKYSTMQSRIQIQYRPSFEKEKYRIQEHIGALFMNIDRKFGSLAVTLGLRGEYANTLIKTDLSLKNTQNIHRIYWNVFPYISLSSDFSDRLNFSVSYRKKIRRPSFSKLNPQYVYRDSLSYTTGNPYLRPVVSDILSISMGFSKLSASVSYSIYRNLFILKDELDSPNSNIVRSTYGNLEKNAKFINGSISYSYDRRIISGMASFNIEKPYVNTPYMGQTLKLRDPIWMFQLSANLKPFGQTSFNGSYLYCSKGNYNNLRKKSFSNLTLGVNQYLLKKRLLLSLSVEDILHMNKSNRWESFNNQIHYIMDSNPDTRCIVITIRYNWGLSDFKMQKKSANTESINRM